MRFNAEKVSDILVTVHPVTLQQYTICVQCSMYCFKMPGVKILFSYSITLNSKKPVIIQIISEFSLLVLVHSSECYLT